MIVFYFHIKMGYQQDKLIQKKKFIAKFLVMGVICFKWIDYSLRFVN